MEGVRLKSAKEKKLTRGVLIVNITVTLALLCSQNTNRSRRPCLGNRTKRGFSCQRIKRQNGQCKVTYFLARKNT